MASASFGSLTMANIINLREDENDNYKDKISESNHLIDSVSFPSCFSISSDIELDRYVLETSTCSEIRKQVLSALWKEAETVINKIRSEIDKNAIDQLINFIKEDFQSGAPSSPALSLIQTAVILGGFNCSDQQAFYTVFQNAALEENIRIARLESLESMSVKDCMKSILDQFIPRDSEFEKDKDYCDYDIQRLVAFRSKEKEVAKKSKKFPPKLAILIPQFEGFPILVLERLLRIFIGRKELDISLMFGISTNLENIHQALSKASLSVLDTRVFQLKQAKECLDKIVTKLFIEAPSDLKLGQKPYEALYNRFHGRDLSISSFIRGVQFSYITHFFGNPLSIFLYPDLEFELVQDEPLHFHLIRSLRSFRSYIENGLAEFGYEDPKAAEYKSLLEDDEMLFEWAKDKVDLVFQHGVRFSIALKALHHMQTFFESNGLKKPIRSLYYFGLKNALVSDNHLQTCVSLFSVLSIEKKRKYLIDLLENLESERLTDDAQLISDILDLFPIDDEEESADEEECGPEQEEAAACFEEENRKRVMKTELNRVKKRRRTQAAKKAGTVQSLDMDPIKAKSRKNLLSYFKSALSSYKNLTLHEIVYFEDPNNLISKTFHAEHRGFVENGIKYPGQYIGCEDCTDDISSHHLDTTVLFKLYNECCGIINLQDWFEAFKSIFDKYRLADEDEELEGSYQARFSRGVEELRYLGFIRHTGRKTDHVQKMI